MENKCICWVSRDLIKEIINSEAITCWLRKKIFDTKKFSILNEIIIIIIIIIIIRYTKFEQNRSNCVPEMSFLVF